MPDPLWHRVCPTGNPDEPLHWEPMLENPFGVPFWFAYTAQFLPVPEAGLVDLPAIKATQRGLTHVLERHFPGGARSAGKSLFNAGEDLAKLLKTAESVAPVKQIRGNFQRVVNVGRTIGVDRATGQATSVYTVITNEAGELVTTFPGRPN